MSWEIVRSSPTQRKDVRRGGEGIVRGPVLRPRQSFIVSTRRQPRRRRAAYLATGSVVCAENPGGGSAGTVTSARTAGAGAEEGVSKKSSCEERSEGEGPGASSSEIRIEEVRVGWGEAREKGCTSAWSPSHSPPPVQGGPGS